jgi:hypothetical protein
MDAVPQLSKNRASSIDHSRLCETICAFGRPKDYSLRGSIRDRFQLHTGSVGSRTACPLWSLVPSQSTANWNQFSWTARWVRGDSISSNDLPVLTKLKTAVSLENS